MVCLSITCSRGSGFFFQAEDGIRDHCVTGVQTCALPISRARWHAAAGQGRDAVRPGARASRAGRAARADLSQSGRVTRKAKEAPAPKERSEEHTSELQSHSDLVCRLLLEKKKPRTTRHASTL